MTRLTAFPPDATIHPLQPKIERLQRSITKGAWTCGLMKADLVDDSVDHTTKVLIYRQLKSTEKRMDRLERKFEALVAERNTDVEWGPGAYDALWKANEDLMTFETFQSLLIGGDMRHDDIKLDLWRYRDADKYIEDEEVVVASPSETNPTIAASVPGAEGSVPAVASVIPKAGADVSSVGSASQPSPHNKSVYFNEQVKDKPPLAHIAQTFLPALNSTLQNNGVGKYAKSKDIKSWKDVKSRYQNHAWWKEEKRSLKDIFFGFKNSSSQANLEEQSDLDLARSSTQPGYGGQTGFPARPGYDTNMEAKKQQTDQMDTTPFRQGEGVGNHYVTRAQLPTNHSDINPVTPYLQGRNDQRQSSASTKNADGNEILNSGAVHHLGSVPSIDMID